MQPNRRTLLAGLAAASLMTGRAARAEAATIRIAIQPGLTYLALNIVQHQKLIEKYAAAAGLPPVTAEFLRLAAGNNVNDAVISGAVDIGATGVPPFLTLWAKTRGSVDVRAITPFNSMPLVLVTRNPAVRRIEDLGPGDRIALPGVGSSSQAVMLQMAAARAFGDAEFRRFDPLTITRGHPDAMAALLSNSEINGHFSAAPYLQRELAVPGMHVLLTSTDIYGGPGTVGLTFTTRQFRDGNPKLLSAFIAAMDDAMQVIRSDTRAAAEAYVAVAADRLGVEEVQGYIADPATLFEITPRGTMKVAEFMYRTGTIKTMPDSWKALFVPEMWHLGGS
jgi:NitT/TauT family transport system substrate-binding protein